MLSGACCRRGSSIELFGFLPSFLAGPPSLLRKQPLVAPAAAPFQTTELQCQVCCCSPHVRRSCVPVLWHSALLALHIAACLVSPHSGVQDTERAEALRVALHEAHVACRDAPGRRRLCMSASAFPSAFTASSEQSISLPNLSGIGSQ